MTSHETPRPRRKDSSMTQQIRLLPPDWQARAPWRAKQARRTFMRRMVRAYQTEGSRRLADALNEIAERDGRRCNRVEVE